MKLIKWLILIIVLLLLAAPFFLEDRHGRPLLTLSDLKKSDMGVPQMLERLPDVSKPTLPGTSSSKIYTWTDEKGQVHYSNQPPPPQVQAKPVQIDPDANVILLDQPKEGSDGGQKSEKDDTGESKIYKGATYITPKNIQKLAEDAAEVEDTLQERKEEYDQIIDQQ
ncbi:MAG: DUF4124 domain-containing protein [Gammaproteobacteria bacterium]|nr:MAG: DUF4124 domain-containing protein [Gammaproteobacteria bacterium]